MQTQTSKFRKHLDELLEANEFDRKRLRPLFIERYAGWRGTKDLKALAEAFLPQEMAEDLAQAGTVTEFFLLLSCLAGRGSVD
jgi:hypothetical protein